MLVGDHEAVAERRERVARVERFGVASGQSHLITACQSGLLGIEVPEVVLVGLDDQRRAGRARERLADLDRHDVVEAAVGEQRGDAEREPLDRRGERASAVRPGSG